MKYVIAVLVAAVLFGTTGTAQALGLSESNPISVGAARLVFGGGLLALASVVMARRAGTRLIPAANLDIAIDPMPEATIRSKRVAPLILAGLGGVAVMAYQPMFFGGTLLNGVAVGTVVALGSAPVFTGVFEAVVQRSFPGRTWLIATIGAIIGVGLLAVGSSSGGGAGLLGLAMSAGAGLAYATYTLIAKSLIAQGWSSSSTVGVMFGFAAIGMVPVLILSGPTWMVTPSGITMVLWLAVVTTLGANLLFGFGLVGLKASTVATLTLAEPLTAGLLGFFLLREVLPPLAAVGLAVLAGSIVWLAVSSARKRPEIAGSDN